MKKPPNQKGYQVIYILDNEQPTTCPRCGARTDFVEWRYKGILIQKHFCLWQYCKYVFIGEFKKIQIGERL